VNRRLGVLLAAAAAFATGGTPEAKRIWSGAEVNLLGGPSPDGRWLSYVDKATGDLEIRELATGQSRRLTSNAAGSGQFAYFSSISPDGRRVAYAWFNDEKFYDLRLTSTAGGGEPLILFRNEEAGFVQPCAWSPDGKQILTLLFRKDNISQIALVDATQPGKFRVLKSLNWVYPNKMDFSPDGRLLVYDNPAADGIEQRDIFVLSMDGSRETRLVSHPANDIFPVWTADGKAVIFVSDRGGSTGLWRQNFADGKPAGDAVLMKAGIGRVLSLGMTPGGQFFYGVRAGATGVRIGEIDLATGRLTSPAQLLTPADAAASAPAWSADGGRLAFLVRMANENFGQESRGIGIVEQGGAARIASQRVLTPRLAHIEKVQWSPDGKRLLASGSDRQSRRGLYLVDAQSAEVTPVVQQRAATYRGMEGVWLAGGESVLYAREGDPFQIREHRLAGGVETVVYEADTGLQLSQLVLSPGSRRLAFVAGNAKAGRDEVRALDLRTSEARTLASLPHGGVLDLEWTPDAVAVLVSAHGDPAPALWRAALDGANPVRLEGRIQRRDGIRLHPNGRVAAFTTGGVEPEVWVMDGFPASRPAAPAR
jgi:Tol biopolymer transport system component